MKEPTVHALGSVLESKKPRPKLWGGSKQFAYGFRNAIFFSASYGKCASRSKIEPAAAAATMAHSSASLHFDRDRYRPERVIGIKSESVITFVRIRKQRKSRCE